MTDEEYLEWYNYQATPEERTVSDKIGQYEELFSDFVFSKDSETVEFLKEKVKDGNSPDSEWKEYIFDIPEKIAYFSPFSVCSIKVRSLEDGVRGSFNTKTKEFTIDSQNVDADSVILHEMIHLYEDMIESQMPFYRDVLYYTLYKDLEKKIPDLDKILTHHGSIPYQYHFNQNGGVHDILFLLKSLDLDIRQGYPLGTVFGYGMVEDLSQIQSK